jgi:hypothetical protein
VSVFSVWFRFLPNNTELQGRHISFYQPTSRLQGFAYRTGPPNRWQSVSVNRSVSRGYRSKPNKFKIQIETSVLSVSIGKPLGKDRSPVDLGGKPT